MEVLFLLIPVSILLLIGISWVLMWAVRSGQFDDLEGPAHRILMDEERVVGQKKCRRDSAGEIGRTDQSRSQD